MGRGRSLSLGRAAAYVEDSGLSSSKCEYIFSKLGEKTRLTPINKALPFPHDLGLSVFRNEQLDWGPGAYNRNPSTCEAEAKRSEVQDHPQLHRWLEAGLGYMRSNLKSQFTKRNS